MPLPFDGREPATTAIDWMREPGAPTTVVIDGVSDVDAVVGWIREHHDELRRALGDGTALTSEEVAALNAACEQATVRRAWQPGDLMLVDNVLTAHGHDPFHGVRRIVVAMGEPVALARCSPSLSGAATGSHGAGA